LALRLRFLAAALRLLLISFACILFVVAAVVIAVRLCGLALVCFVVVVVVVVAKFAAVFNVAAILARRRQHCLLLPLLVLVRLLVYHFWIAPVNCYPCCASTVPLVLCVLRSVRNWLLVRACACVLLLSLLSPLIWLSHSRARIRSRFR